MMYLYFMHPKNVSNSSSKIKYIKNLKLCNSLLGHLKLCNFLHSFDYTIAFSHNDIKFHKFFLILRSTVAKCLTLYT
jgi:hypothetical protein